MTGEKGQAGCVKAPSENAVPQSKCGGKAYSKNNIQALDKKQASLAKMMKK